MRGTNDGWNGNTPLFHIIIEVLRMQDGISRMLYRLFRKRNKKTQNDYSGTLTHPIVVERAQTALQHIWHHPLFSPFWPRIISAQYNNGYLFTRYSAIVEVKYSNFNFSIWSGIFAVSFHTMASSLLYTALSIRQNGQ